MQRFAYLSYGIILKKNTSCSFGGPNANICESLLLSKNCDTYKPPAT